MSDAHILMYHRVCRRTPETRCYFERGTAVEVGVFEQQIEWLAANYDVVSLRDWWSGRRQRIDSPVVVVTFDDGYRDVLDTAGLCLDRHRIRPAIFPIAGHTGGASELAWVDAYYAVLHRARSRGPSDLRALGVAGIARGPALDDGLRWWVRGPLKEALHRTPPPLRAETLSRLASVLDPLPSPDAPELYLSEEELRAVAHRGWDVGGHGVRHSRMAGASMIEVRSEVRGASALLDRLSCGGSRFYCYPDGSHDAAAERVVKEAGYVGALTVAAGLAGRTTHPYQLPRHLVRNLPPDSARWCAAFPQGAQ